eukprot:2616515-Rhodomonas_salina.1
MDGETMRAIEGEGEGEGKGGEREGAEKEGAEMLAESGLPGAAEDILEASQDGDGVSQDSMEVSRDGDEQSHASEALPDDPLQCRFCGKSFKHAPAKIQHERAHENQLRSPDSSSRVNKSALREEENEKGQKEQETKGAQEEKGLVGRRMWFSVLTGMRDRTSDPEQGGAAVYPKNGRYSTLEDETPTQIGAFIVSSNLTRTSIHRCV